MGKLVWVSSAVGYSVFILLTFVFNVLNVGLNIFLALIAVYAVESGTKSAKKYIERKASVR